MFIVIQRVKLVGVLEIVLFSHILGIVIPIDTYFSEGWLNHQQQKYPDAVKLLWVGLDTPDVPRVFLRNSIASEVFRKSHLVQRSRRET